MSAPELMLAATLVEVAERVVVAGYGGLLGGTVLLLRVVAAVARDGTT